MPLKTVLAKIIPRKAKKSLRNFWILADKYGQRRSIKYDKCLDKKGQEIPWYTYPAYEYLNSLDFKDLDILEFGSGASSTWWAERAKSVTSIEHNKEWYEIVKQRQTNNLKIIFAETEEKYISAGNFEKYDVVVIDGQYRHACAKNLKNIIKGEGLIILDNADRHPTTAKLLRETYNLLQVDMHGFGPINDYTWTTSLFFSRGFQCLPKTNRLPVYSVGALKELAE
ncbi:MULTISPECIES: SAM-dependent methyltransferase [Methylophaga]|jgi:2-polyprenyl-3-methyl-5-hydroxy-6-metoxy-1,4-benzoquinol methylase|uniref:SAM-dependent methyltransferase n=1 Tax=Methylophaga TaxID=40222 RepID=UPI000C6A8C6E|nr:MULTISPECIES: SAM-dependent methyltransferase [Methylophaga]MAM28210.1 SAM-dependent methyltransferase [Flavobacteriaceae bacterium]MAL49844.1 SAM-dependent methyltransferase [Methylophaga sp.]MBP24071.1 SAM-dependent methyltransferase [Methylophaga sp.]HCC80514.1 SAM-dependent methyltransferase [Methylophaga sp.]HIC45774.1 SAM-dependent methyltransferase [Methylophaga sp.]|tara:strand:+ start:2477 stop:3154 length:678 start_codon:yes stop_codon:yes gene_type:complete